MRRMNWSGAVLPPNATEPPGFDGRLKNKEHNTDGNNNLRAPWWQN
jgi:hypothetical protein